MSLLSTKSPVFLMPSEEIRSSWVEWFHECPHLDFSFRPIDDAFSPSSAKYRESLVIIGLMPGVFVILIFLALLSLLISVIWCRKLYAESSPISVNTMKKICVIISILSLFSVCLLLLFNDSADSGVNEAGLALSAIDSKITSVGIKLETLSEKVAKELQPELKQFLSYAINPKFADQDFKSHLLNAESNVLGLVKTMDELQERLHDFDLSNVTRTLAMIERIRWVSQIVLTPFLILVILMVPVGIWHQHRNFLIMFAVLGLIVLAICGTKTSVYLLVNVAVSDFCMNPPDLFFETELAASIEKDILSYYMKCGKEEKSRFKIVDKLWKEIEILKSTILLIEKFAKRYSQTQIGDRLDHLSTLIKESESSGEEIAGLIVCEEIFPDYKKFVNSVCFDTMYAFPYLFLTSMVVTLLLSILVWFTLILSIYI